MPFFFDLSSAFPTIERNPFAPLVVADALPVEEKVEEMPAEPIIDTGLPLPSSYPMDLMRALVQDPFHLFVYWHLKDNPFDRLLRVFPEHTRNSFQTVLKLIDEGARIAVYFDAAFAREYWFDVFPGRAYRIELGLRSPHYGYIKLLSSQTVETPRGTVSDQAAPEPEYKIAPDDYLRVLRESHILPERAFTPEGLLPALAQTAEERAAAWEMLPRSFRRLIETMLDIQAGRAYDKLWERLEQEDLAAIVREFIGTISQMGGGELGYILLLRHLPELLRRAMAAEGEIVADAPLSFYLAEQFGQSVSSSEMNAGPPSETSNQQPTLRPGRWLPSLTA